MDGFLAKDISRVGTNTNLGQKMNQKHQIRSDQIARLEKLSIEKCTINVRLVINAWGVLSWQL